MADLLTWQVFGTTLLIFFVRVLSISMDTLRFMFTMRGKRTIAWFLGFFESVLFVLTVGVVLNDMTNFLYIIAYAAGYATGNVIGMYIERKLAVGYSHISVISKTRGSEVSHALRENDFAVTEIPAQGMEGPVCISDLSVRRKDIADVEKIVKETDPEAFITIEEVTPLRAGYWGRQNVKR
ncbi:MAG: DUF5698 domain-containing protein [Anaerolineaceae bacterium]|mgnify:CR=1 FL=1|jgi:uncharacterized protein YebE (UPF0316 family)